MKTLSLQKSIIVLIIIIAMTVLSVMLVRNLQNKSNALMQGAEISASAQTGDKSE